MSGSWQLLVLRYMSVINMASSLGFIFRRSPYSLFKDFLFTFGNGGSFSRNKENAVTDMNCPLWFNKTCLWKITPTTDFIRTNTNHLNHACEPSLKLIVFQFSQFYAIQYFQKSIIINGKLWRRVEFLFFGTCLTLLSYS